MNNPLQTLLYWFIRFLLRVLGETIQDHLVDQQPFTKSLLTNIVEELDDDGDDDHKQNNGQQQQQQ